MNIYLISQEVNRNYGVYDSAVVIAESEEDAVKMHPSGEQFDERTWCAIESVNVEFLSKAKDGAVPCVICSSFNDVF